ncbi:MAG: BMP family protein [Acidiphilium sp.]
MTVNRRQILAASGALATATLIARAHAADEFKMGLLVTGSVAENGWNRLAYNALMTVKKKLGVKVSYVELQQDPASFESAFRDYASQGYQVILGNGFEFQDSAITVSKEYPNSYFLISSSSVHQGKVIGLNLDSSQPFYLMGVIAAKMGKSAGLIGGMQIPPISQAFEGFRNGALATKPGFGIGRVYIGSFENETAAKEAAIGMIKQGVDFIVPDADAASLGVYLAVHEAGPQIKTFGVYTDYSKVAGKNILGTYIADFGAGIVRVVTGIKNGTSIPHSNVNFGLGDSDVIKFIYNDDAATPVPQDIRKYVDKVKTKIIAGQIKTMAS